MRDTTVLRRLLAIPAVRVSGIALGPDGLIVDVRLRRNARLRCSACGFSTPWTYDRRPPRLWRHLDLAGRRCFLRMAVRRLRCPEHGVITEAVPFAPARSGYTYALEDLVAWLAQRADKTAITDLVRVSWRSVGRILERWMARHRSGDQLDGLRHIAIDEKSWRKGHRYVTVVADHDRPRVVWIGEGREPETLLRFVADLGPERAAALEAISLDMGAAYLKALERAALPAERCFDPFHVVKLANAALDAVRREEWNRARASDLPARAIKYTRWALLKRPGGLNARQRETLVLVRRHNHRLWRGYEIKETVRAIYGASTVIEASIWLRAAINAARRSRLRPFRTLAETLHQHQDGILAAVRHRLSNSRLEGLNSRLALINHRASGFHSVGAFMALALLCTGGFKPALPHQ